MLAGLVALPRRRLGDRVAVRGDPAADDFRIAPVLFENVTDQLANLFVALLMEDQDRRTGPAQSAAEQSGRAQTADLIEPWNQREPVGLVHPIFQRRRESTGGAGGQG